MLPLAIHFPSLSILGNNSSSVFGDVPVDYNRGGVVSSSAPRYDNAYWAGPSYSVSSYNTRHYGISNYVVPKNNTSKDGVANALYKLASDVYKDDVTDYDTLSEDISSDGPRFCITDYCVVGDHIDHCITDGLINCAFDKCLSNVEKSNDADDYHLFSYRGCRVGMHMMFDCGAFNIACLLYTSPSPRDA